MRGRCDHSPEAPRLALVVEPIPNQPWLNREAQKRAQRMFHRPRLFPELTGHGLAGPATRIRSRRSSRREAWALMAASIMRHTDRRTFRIGDQRDDGLCNGVSIKRHQEETGLSRWRVSTTLREFEGAAFLVTRTQPVEALKDKQTGRPILDDAGKQRYRAFPAQRRVTHLFFTRLGFTAAKIKKARKRGYEEWCRRRAPAQSAVAILGGRQAVRRLVASNRQRDARLAAGVAPASSPPAPVTERTPAHIDARNREREERLSQLDMGPPPKPPSSR